MWMFLKTRCLFLSTQAWALAARASAPAREPLAALGVEGYVRVMCQISLYGNLTEFFFRVFFSMCPNLAIPFSPLPLTPSWQKNYSPSLSRHSSPLLALQTPKPPPRPSPCPCSRPPCPPTPCSAPAQPSMPAPPARPPRSRTPRPARRSSPASRAPRCAFCTSSLMSRLPAPTVGG
ncbi:hypothetical protein B0H19DRAFT_435722 [Mycena capillaripes]|nr:hypothetical protein B0H19DRAFT_435722 [Mycena capillaripes]